MLPPIFPALMASTAVKAIVGSPPDARVYRHGAAKQGLTQPYITWALVTGEPYNTLSELPAVDRQTVQVDCWYPALLIGANQIEAFADAVRDAIEPYAHMTATLLDLQEPDTKLYRISMQFDWFLSR